MLTSSGMNATHKGWFSFCPVYVDMDYGDGPAIEARWAILEPLLSLATWMQGTAVFVAQFIDPDYEPAFRIRLTAELGR